VDRNDKVCTLLYKIVMHKKMSHPDEIQNIIIYIYIIIFIIFDCASLLFSRARVY